MKYTFTLFLSICFFSAFSQADTLEVTVEFPKLRQALKASPHEVNIGIGQSSQSQQIIYLPYINGELKAFKLIEYDIVPAQLRKEIKTYYGQMVEDASVNCRLTLMNGEIKASLKSPTASLMVEKNTRSTNANAYWVYEAVQTLAECEVEEQIQKQIDKPTNGNTIMFNSHGTQLRTYRLALLVTNTLYTAGGGTNALVNAYVASIVNNINAIFEKEIAVRFVLVSPNNPVSSNVFYNYGTGATNLSDIRPEVLNRFGVNNFDVGHCIRSSGGGVANLGVVCSSTSKGGGLSGVSPSNILIFAHELGHQFNAGHTFNGNGSGNCGPGNRMSSHAYEPGSGNTIMSYANLCSPGSYNITGGKVPYFHTHNQTTMIQHITTRPDGCGVITNTGNAVPVITLTSALTIPKSTPFTLTGTATDGNGDALSYTWEQYNLATVADTGRLGNTANTSGISAINSTSAPLFRTFQSSNGTRNFPNVQYVINNANNPADNIGEDLPAVSRTMKFRLTARDNKDGGGGVAFEEIVINVANAGPFEIITGNSSTLWFQGVNTNIKWAVNGTNIAPINVSNVKISLSTDGGQTFPIILAASTPNDGSFDFNVPNITSAQARIKIEAIGNVFYDINNVDITITNNCTPEISFISPETTLTAQSESASLNLSQVSYGEAISSFAGSIESTDRSGNLSFERNNLCNGPSNSNKFDTYEFYVANEVTYTFTFSGAFGLIMNLYNETYNQNSVCSNWIASSGTSTGGSVSPTNNLTATLTPGKYVLTISSFSNSLPSLPSTYTITYSGATINKLSPQINSPYAYTYLVYNVTTGTIVSFQNTANLMTLFAGNYRLYGLSYQGGFDLSPYINTSFSTFQNALNGGTFCGKLSSNSRDIIINSPCPTSISLGSPSDNTASGTVKQETSGSIIATNNITGGNVIYDAANSIQLNPGFSAGGGAVFSAYIDGCGGQ